MKSFFLALALLPTAAFLAFEAKADAVQPRAVRIAVALPGSGLSIRTYPGKTEAVRHAMLFFRVSGPLESRPVVLGSKVCQGDLLMRIDPRDYKVQQATLESDLDALKATNTLARAQYERKKRMLESNSISRQEYDAAHADAQASDAQVRKASAALAHARDQVGDTELRAPFDGRVTQISVERNEMVQAGVPVLRLEDIGELKIRLSIPCRDLPGLFGTSPEGRKFDVHVPAGLQGPDGGTAASGAKAALPAATLTELSPSALTESESVEAVLTMPRPEGLDLLPGMSVEVSASSGDGPAASPDLSVVPYSAVSSDGTGSRVWVYDPVSGRIASRPVTVVRTSGRKSALIRGAEPGLAVVEAGGDWLTENEQVAVLNPDALSGKTGPAPRRAGSTPKPGASSPEQRAAGHPGD